MAIHFMKVTPGDLFARKGDRVSRLEGYFTDPSFDMLDLRSGQRENFGQDGETARSWRHPHRPKQTPRPSSAASGATTS